MLSAERTPRHPLFRTGSPIRMSVNSQTSSSTRKTTSHQMSDHIEHIFIITGPAGCGKTTVAQHLAKQLAWPYVEGDDFHTPANKTKMADGIPLTDADRWDWLITLRTEAVKHLQHCNSVIVTCSALKHKYRDVIRIANYEHPTVQIHFVYLKVDEQTLQQRVAGRVGHYMKEGMVHSQMSALEEPDVDDETDVIPVDVTNDKEWVQSAALEKVKDKLRQYEEWSRVEQ